MLRLGKEFTKDERVKRVDEILQFVCHHFSNYEKIFTSLSFQLNLTKTEDTTIGIPGIVKGLSGGEKRRLTFATEVRKNFEYAKGY
jgi:ABC-type multidrug transport system ATPase subunit